VGGAARSPACSSRAASGDRGRAGVSSLAGDESRSWGASIRRAPSSKRGALAHNSRPGLARGGGSTCPVGNPHRPEHDPSDRAGAACGGRPRRRRAGGSARSHLAPRGATPRDPFTV